MRGPKERINGDITSSNEFLIFRGINVSHWLSQNPDKGPERAGRLTEEDIQFLAECGFDHLRVPVDEEHLWTPDGNKDTDAFKLLHQLMEWCKAYDLRVVLDLHQIRSHTFNSLENPLWESDKEKKRFITLWKDLSGELSKYPNSMLAYELLNEAVAPHPDDWNNLAGATIDTLRKNEPHRKIIIGSNRWQSPDTFNDLVVPENDSNLILSFHFYSPFLLTHYRTHWNEIGQYSGPVQYPGPTVSKENIQHYDPDLIKELIDFTRVFNQDTLLRQMMEPINFARTHKLQLYCGEFGCVPAVPRSSRMKWYEDICQLFDENNIARASWDYRGAFSIFNLQTGHPDKNLIYLLTNKEYQDQQ